MGKEKRRYKRLPIRGFMKCATDFVFNDHLVAGIDVLSLSAGGMFIALDERNSVGIRSGDDLVEIQLHVGELRGMALKGRVAHLMSLGEIGGCGVEFVDLHDDTAARIDRYVNRKLEEFGLAAF